MENSDSIVSPKVDAAFEKYSRFIGEIRYRIVTVLIVFALATVLGFVFYSDIIRFLIGFLSLKGVNIVFTSPFQFINLSISAGIASGIIFSVPILVYELFSFLRPALKNKEYKTLYRLLPFSLFLFILGFLFGLYIMKWQIEIFLNQSQSIGIGNILDISKLLSVVLLTSALMGVAFQFPLVLLLLLRLGILKPETVSKYRGWVYLGAFIFAIILPPDSIIADILLSLPLIFLFEITLLINKSSMKRATKT